MKQTFVTCDVMQLWRHQAIKYKNCWVFLPVSTSTKSIKIDQETPELLSEIKVARFLWLTVYNTWTVNVADLLSNGCCLSVDLRQSKISSLQISRQRFTLVSLGGQLYLQPCSQFFSLHTHQYTAVSEQETRTFHSTCNIGTCESEITNRIGGCDSNLESNHGIVVYV